MEKSEELDKEVYHPNKVEGQQFDSIIIGSGIGGLSAASLLAQAGKKVLVLEQHYVAGGACHTFESGGYRFATGVHYVGDLRGHGFVKFMLDSLTPEDDPLIWDRMNENFETVVIGDPSARFEIWAGEETYEKKLLEKFPDEKKAIRKYIKLTHKARAALQKGLVFKSLPLPLARCLTWTGLHRLSDGGYSKMAKKSVKEVLEGLTDNKDLQAVFAYNFGDYGVEPSRAPILLQAGVTRHYMNGAYYPRGGPSMIPKKIIKEIVNCGGQVLVAASVKRVVIDDKTRKATGVEMEDGHTIHATTVISDVGLINTATKLLPPDLIDIVFAEDDRELSKRLHPSVTGTSLFVGLEGNNEELNLPKCHHWIYPSNDLSGAADKLRKMSLDEALQLDPKDISLLFVGVPSAKDKAWADEYPNKSALELIMFSPWHWFEKFESTSDTGTKSHGPAYEEAKKALAEKMWARLLEVLEPTGAKLPRTLDQVDHFQVASPLTFAHFYKSEHGSFFGLDNDMKRYAPKNYFLRLRPEIPEVVGLYLTGQDVTCDGVGSASLGGLLCAQKVLGVRKPFSLLRKPTEAKETKADEQAPEEKQPSTNVGAA